MRFGVGVPTGTEGMMYPVPYADVGQAVELSLAADRLGYDSVWGNDHISTQRYVRDDFPDPPRFYDPLGYMAYVAAKTTGVRVCTAVLVLPFRHPVVVAKQIATLDQLSGGRVSLGVGIGAYREEFESMWPDRQLHRGDYARECIEALSVLFTERRASYDGDYISFRDVESYPKPVQDPLPILSGGNAAGTKERAGRYCHGWLPACLTVQEMAEGLAEIQAAAEAHGRTLPEDFDVAPQMGVAIGRTHEDAVATFERSQLHAHTKSLAQSTLKGRQADIEGRNLIGTADEIAERVTAYRDVGVTTMAGLLFANNDVAETLEAMEEFAEGVMSHFRAPAPA